MHRQTVSVPFEYPVYFTDGLFLPGNTALLEAIRFREPTKRHRVLLLIDDGVANAWPQLEKEISHFFAAHADAVELVEKPVILRGGEACKNDSGPLNDVYRVLHEQKIDRHSFVVMIGGGALLDMAGYAAATAHRGVRVIRVPTTVLSQADSGVGVKNGINAFGKKNFLGTFAPPFAVINDLRFLSTLSLRDRIGGMAEAIKVGLVRDRSFFEWVARHAERLREGEPAALSKLVRRSAELHLQHIATSGDPFEQGSARPLDFGHWAAHKLESLTAHRLRHGEAVAIGMAIDTLYSVKRGYADAELAKSVLSTLTALGFSLWDDALALDRGDAKGPKRAVLDGLSEFREHLGGELTVTLLHGAGEGFEVHEMDESSILFAIESLKSLDKHPRR